MFTQVRDQVDRERADSEQLRHRLLPVPAACELPGRAAHRLQAALDRHAFTRFSTVSHLTLCQAELQTCVYTCLPVYH